MCSSQKEIRVEKPRLWPAALVAGQTAEVGVRTVVYHASDQVQVTLEQIDGDTWREIAALEALNLGEVANFKTTITFEASGDVDLQLRIKARDGDQTLVSEVLTAPVSGFPLRPNPTIKRASDWVTNPDGVGEATPDSVLVTFGDQVDETQIRNLVTKADLRVLRHFPQQNLFELYIPEPWSADKLQRILTDLRSRPEVARVEVNGIMSHQ